MQPITPSYQSTSLSYATGQELTAVRFDDAGLQVAVGTRNGLVGVYDLRSQRPVVVKDHMYGSRWVKGTHMHTWWGGWTYSVHAHHEVV